MNVDYLIKNLNKYLLIIATLLLSGCTSKTYDKCRIETLTVENPMLGTHTVLYNFACAKGKVSAQGVVLKNPLVIITNDPDRLMGIKVYQSRFVSYNVLYSVSFDNAKIGNMGIGATIL